MSAKGGSVLGAIALIIAIGALGFELYNVYLAPAPLEDEKEIGGTWYKSVPGAFEANPEETYVVFSDLTIQFNINTGESVYVSYNGLIILKGTIPEIGYISLYVYFSLDGVRLESPKIYTQFYFEGVTSMYHPASLQYFNSTLPAGTHNITIVLWGTILEGLMSTRYNEVKENTLFVQTYLS